MSESSASPATYGSSLWGAFDLAYKMACASSQPRDWMEAALIAQQIRYETTVSEIAPSDACRAALANIMARIDGDEFVPTEYKEDAKKALASFTSAIRRLDTQLARENYEAPEGWQLKCEKCGADVTGPCGWPSDCPTGLGR